MKKDNRFQRKYASNDKVTIGKSTQVWTVCRQAHQDDNKHVYYKLSRGSWKTSVRGDLLNPAV